MRIFKLNIVKNKKEPSFWTYVAIVSTKRGRKILYINGKENKDKNFTIDFWINSEIFAKLDKTNYIKIIKENQCKN